MTDPELARRYPLIPWPRHLDVATGTFDDRAAIAQALRGEPGPSVAIGLQPDAPEGAEAYALTVTPERIELRAREAAGLRHGLATLRQLAAAPGGMPAVRIEDAPRFSYRGLHLDVGRHFFPVAFIKKYIDAMAAFKLNTFHWHLTEDQGWRLEIQRYPELTTVGAWRDETIIGPARDRPERYDGKRHGGFYTQAEAREVVAYAAERGITVLPEIEMPGHALALIAAYPELANVPGPFTVRTTWGISDHVLSPREETFTFLENVLAEVLDIFPGEFIH
ncbi:MAG TPA: family 20 glycosylhydrolase, partial [Candidatus Saccharimonadales bacterium]|nr:family 20 glycosylhydrolase [Candidatus Saccharimonadales bacterium]